MYRDDEIERWRRSERNPRDGAASQHSAPSVSASSSSSSRSYRSQSTSTSWRSWESRCIRTGEYCAAGHELLQIPVADRQRYLQRKEMLLQRQENLQLQQQQQQQQQQYSHPHDAPLTINPSPMVASAPSPILIECDCCSRVIGKQQYIAGCCLECDIDVCGDCFKNGQSYIDVVLKESRESDMYDERHQQQKEHNYQSDERYNGIRPTYIGSGRVNYDDYPDPTAFQWSFTGSSCDHDSSVPPVEYFEKDFGKAVGVIRLDFFYTIGTVRTTIVDPIRRTIRELFTKSRQNMSAQSYRKILKDPRTYNNERYKKGSQTNFDDIDYWRRKRQQVL